jgi:hypothetical protein
MKVTSRVSVIGDVIVGVKEGAWAGDAVGVTEGSDINVWTGSIVAVWAAAAVEPGVGVF